MAKKVQKEAKEPAFTNKIAVRTDQNFMGYTGSTPFILFDENWNQMALDNTKTIIPREHVTRGFRLAFEGGVLSVLKPPESIKTLLIIILLFTLVMGGISGFIGYGNSQDIKLLKGDVGTVNGNQNTTTTQLNALGTQLNTIMLRMNITNSTSSIPTVGG